MLCSLWIIWPDGFGEMKRLAVLLVKLSTALVFAFVMFSAALLASVASCWLIFCGTALDVTVVGAPKLRVVGVGLLFIKLSTNADDTLGVVRVEVNVLARGGTIGMNGIGCAGLMVCVWGADVGTELVAGVGIDEVKPSSNGCEGF